MQSDFAAGVRARARVGSRRISKRGVIHVANRASRTDPGGCCEVSTGVARQRAVVILATLVAFEVFHRLEFAIADVAPRARGWTVDRIAVAPRPAMIAQHCQAVATHATGLAHVLLLGDALGDPALLPLLRRARRRGSDVPNTWGGRRSVSPRGVQRGQQQAPTGRARRAGRGGALALAREGGLGCGCRRRVGRRRHRG